MNANSGDRVWRTRADFRVAERAQPTVAVGRLSLGGQDRNLHALDTDGGEHHWTFETEAIDRESDRHNFYSSPAVHQGRAYFGGQDGNIYAVDVADGSELWRVRGKGQADLSPGVAAGVVYAENSQDLLAIDAETGAIHWARNTPAQAHASLIIGNGRIYYSTDDGYLYALEGT